MSKPLIILGDVHGNINHCLELCERFPNNTILQLGDLGVGFIPTNYLLQVFPKNFRFFVGNHDNRSEANKLPHNLGNFGDFENIFFVSGADSIDKGRRTIGVNWWSDEELSHAQANDCYEAWMRSKAKVIVSHDCPQRVATKYFNIPDKSLTRQLLDAMIDGRKPKQVIFGHHHRKLDVKSEGIHYVALRIDESYPLTKI